VLIKTALLLVACHCTASWFYSLDISEGKVTLLLLLLLLLLFEFLTSQLSDGKHSHFLGLSNQQD
jgi:hypothetical protein